MPIRAAELPDKVPHDCEHRVARLAKFADRTVVCPTGKHPVIGPVPPRACVLDKPPVGLQHRRLFLLALRDQEQEWR